nr:D-tyrosyl-tRNA(Tyr) deacylase 1 isoform X3 [Pogona vitticeps]
MQHSNFHPKQQSHEGIVGGEQISSIGKGICVLLGISVEDTQKELEHMVRKILNLRVFEDESGKHWSKSVMDKQYEVLCVSQFTLQCILKGNKPDYHMAMPTEQAESFYNSFLEHLRKTYKPELVKDGKFGEYMQVHIQNDGPVTIELESSTAPIDSKQEMSLPFLWINDSCGPVFAEIFFPPEELSQSSFPLTIPFADSCTEF